MRGHFLHRQGVIRRTACRACLPRGACRHQHPALLDGLPRTSEERRRRHVDGTHVDTADRVHLVKQVADKGRGVELGRRSGVASNITDEISFDNTR